MGVDILLEKFDEAFERNYREELRPNVEEMSAAELAESDRVAVNRTVEEISAKYGVPEALVRNALDDAAHKADDSGDEESEQPWERN